MTTLDRAVSEFYTDGKMNEQGFMTLQDMHETLEIQRWKTMDSIAYVQGNHSCTFERAESLILWALSKLTA